MNFFPSLGRNRVRPNRGKKREPIRFVGEFESWAEAEKESTGYAAPEILEKTRAALLKVKQGEAAFERDSVLFPKPEYEFALLAGLLRVAARNGAQLSVVDFGGALGGTYFQHRSFLSSVRDLQWSVIDQPAHVKCGEADFANDQLRFYETIADCLSERTPNVLLLSGVLQYLREPYAFLENVLREKIPYVIVERTSFDCGGRDRLMVEQVPAWIYDASYPIWFLNEATFRKGFAQRYQLVCEYKADDEPNSQNVVFKGFQFEARVGESSENGGS